MGGGQKSTTTTTVTQTPEEKEFTKQQIELAKQQLRLVEEQHGWQSEIYAITKPLLEKYGLMIEDEFTRYNTPEAQALRDRYAQLESAQLDAQLRNLPIQEELLQLQLDEIRRGGRATPEQQALIAEITNRAIETGDTDISRFLDQGFTQLREELAPARGLRPSDSPILDAGGEVLEEALRQKGQLTSQMRGAQANAELNFPLNASQVYSAQNQWQQNFQANMGQFLSQQRQTAEQNRNALMQQLFTAPMASGEQGISLINAARPSPVSFPRNTTETTKTSGGSVLGGIGGLLSGIGSIAGSGLFSSKKLKEDVRPIEAPEGHILSPGALKYDKRQLTRGYNNTYRTGWGGEGVPRSENGARPPYPGLDQHPLLGDHSPITGGGSTRRLFPMFPMGGNNTPLREWGGPPPVAQTQPESGGAPATSGLGLTAKPPGPDVTFDPPRPDDMVGAGSQAGPNPVPLNEMTGTMPQPVGLGFANPPQTDEDALERIANLPVSQWRYKPETGLGTEPHIGPMAEDFNTQVMGQGPNPTISVVDSLGALTASIKALEKRTRGGQRNGLPRNQYWGIQHDPRTQRKRKRLAGAA